MSGCQQAKDFTDYKACDASRFTDWYGDVHENIQEADLIGSCWEFGVDEYNSDIFGDYFVELLDNGYARISWSEKEYGIEDYSDIIYEPGHVRSRMDILICLYKVRGQVVNGIMREKILLTGQKIIVFIFQQTEQCYCWKIRKDLQGCLQRREYIMY